jgi:hypothetical protein
MLHSAGNCHLLVTRQTNWKEIDSVHTMADSMIRLPWPNQHGSCQDRTQKRICGGKRHRQSKVDLQVQGHQDP